MKKNSVWFVTGASKGLGLVLVQRLLKEGHKVVATSRSRSSLQKAISAENENFLPLKVNLSDESNLKEAVTRSLKKFDRIDVLVNNAGYGQIGALEEVSDQESRENFEVNVFGLLNVTRAIAPVMRAQRSGHIFNISSIGGLFGSFPGWGIYCATKFAVSGITEGLRLDMQEFGVNVTLVYPGYFRTNFLQSDSVKGPRTPIDAYAEAKKSRELHANTINGNQTGDPEKAAKVMIDMTTQQDPPLHLFLGSDAVKMAKVKLSNVEADLARWKEVSESTDF